MTDRSARLRTILFRTVIVLTLAVLGFELWRLQIVRGAYYQGQAEHNRFRLVSTDAPRGVIYDRFGQLLARNVPSYAVTITPADLPEDPDLRLQVFRQLGEFLSIAATSDGQGIGAPYSMIAAPSSISDTVAANMDYPYDPVIIKRQVDRDVALSIEESHLDLPGVQLAIDPVREYPSGPVTSHIIGYTGSIPSESADRYEDLGYDVYRESIGLTGVESTFEQYLHGTRGRKHIEVDIAGRELRELNTPLDAVPGNSLVLSLNLNLQRAVETALMHGLEAGKSKAGSAIVMNPNTGEVLALVSLPTYDNNLFAGGISAQEYSRLINDPLHPLVDHAIGGQYPPGSTFKFITALAGLEEGVITPDTTVNCTGSIVVPNKYFPDDPKLAQVFKCWVPTGHGTDNLIKAMGDSCDVYFYTLGGGFGERQGIGVVKLSSWAGRFGLGAATGIELPGEVIGLVPNDDWKLKTIREPWVTGDTYNMSIGQGYVLVSPLQLATAISAVANGGTVYRPAIVREIRDASGKVVMPFAPEAVGKLNASEADLETVRQGLIAASSWGTGYRAAPQGLKVAGKTGTAEYPGPLDKEGHLPTHSWYTSFAPADKPEISVTVLVEGGGDGALVAAPVANEIYTYWMQTR